MTQRIRGITDEEATGPAKELFEASNKMLGRTANLMRILAHSPYLARWTLPFIAAVRQPNAGAVSDVLGERGRRLVDNVRRAPSFAQRVEIAEACSQRGIWLISVSSRLEIIGTRPPPRMAGVT